jgi:hypothetical protein
MQRKAVNPWLKMLRRNRRKRSFLLFGREQAIGLS